MAIEKDRRTESVKDIIFPIAIANWPWAVLSFPENAPGESENLFCFDD